MPHITALAIATLWIAASVALWSQKQEQIILFLESLGMGGVAFGALYWYVTRIAK